MTPWCNKWSTRKYCPFLSPLLSLLCSADVLPLVWTKLRRLPDTVDWLLFCATSALLISFFASSNIEALTHT